MRVTPFSQLIDWLGLTAPAANAAAIVKGLTVEPGSKRSTTARLRR